VLATENKVKKEGVKTERSWSDYRMTIPLNPDIFDMARNGDLRGLAGLLQRKPDTDLEACNPRGYSPLMLSIYNGQHVFSEALLRAGVNPDSPDSMGNTPLMAAAFKGDRDCLELLVKYGASSTCINRAGMNAWDWAATFARRDALRFFEETRTDMERSPWIVNVLRLLGLALRWRRSTGNDHSALVKSQ